MLNSIHSDLIRGHIDTIILSVLHEGDRYGYDILGEIERKSGGEYVLKQPTLYSCLKRLETQGFIYKYWGTETNGGRRTYYSLTEMGKELFQHNKDEWKYSRGVIDKLISTPEDPSAIIETVAIDADPSLDAVASVAPAPETENTAVAATVAEISTETEEEFPAPRSSVAGTQAEDREELLAEYANVLADAEKDEILTDAGAGDGITSYVNNVMGVSYADRLSHEKETAETKENENIGIPFFAHDCFSDDNEDETDESDSEKDYLTDNDTTAEFTQQKTAYPEDAFYKEADFESEAHPSDKFSAEAAKRTQSDSRGPGVFKSYENAELSEETNREIVVGREYLGVIKRLLSGDTDADTYYSQLREVGATTAVNEERPVTEPVGEQPRIVTETQPPVESNADGPNFDDLLVSVRSMGDEVRIRTHNRAIDKEYNSLYHYYANKLLLFKYGFLFAVMILEIVIPYFIIKFGFKISPIAGELPVLVLSVVGAALLPIYAISAFLIDPYKRKRYDFDLKNSLLYRLGIMLLMLILIYAVNVVFYMDISFDVEYAFSLITPALLSTNIPLSAIVFKTLYDSKRFSAE